MPHFTNITIVSLVICFVSTGHSLAVAAQPKADESAVMRWLERAESNAKKVDETDRQIIWTEIASLYARLGKLDKAQTAVENCGEKKMHHSMAFVAIGLAKMGRADEAIEFAHRIPEGTERGFALRLIIRIQADRHEFEELKKTIQRMKEPQKGVDWHDLAESLAKAGRYDEAMEVSKKVTPTDEDTRELKRDLLKFIANARAESRKDKPRASPSTMAEGARGVANAFAGGNDPVQDLAKATAAAAKLDSPYSRASEWRRIAWAHLRRGEAVQARQALQTALDATRESSELAEITSFNSVLIADAYLELGDQDTAAKLVVEILGADKKIGSGLESFITGPVVIGVLVRTGNIDQAFQGIDLNDGFNSSSLMAFGDFCASTGKADEVKKRLAKVGSFTNKACLCLGVAAGLYELEQAKKATQAKSR